MILLRLLLLIMLLCHTCDDLSAAGTGKERAKNFQWGLRRSTLNYLMCIQFTDVAHVANTARNYEILHERDDDDAERPNKQQKSGDRHQPTTQQSSQRNHGHNNDRHGSDRRSSGDNHRNNNNYSGNNNNMLNFKSIQSSSTHKHDPNITSRGPSEGYSYPVCTTCGRRHPGECHRAADRRLVKRHKEGLKESIGQNLEAKGLGSLKWT
nr:hypothetical protein [Tanacetum cinerariifolium]